MWSGTGHQMWMNGVPPQAGQQASFDLILCEPATPHTVGAFVRSNEPEFITTAGGTLMALINSGYCGGPRASEPHPAPNYIGFGPNLIYAAAGNSTKIRYTIFDRQARAIDVLQECAYACGGVLVELENGYVELVSIFPRVVESAANICADGTLMELSSEMLVRYNAIEIEYGWDRVERKFVGFVAYPTWQHAEQRIPAPRIQMRGMNDKGVVEAIATALYFRHLVPRRIYLARTKAAIALSAELSDLFIVDSSATGISGGAFRETGLLEPRAIERDWGKDVTGMVELVDMGDFHRTNSDVGYAHCDRIPSSGGQACALDSAAWKVM
jgi:hypothetical protein